eukprot:CAMPEP_0184677878 /NCGR_PEP_ID=MMETSP0312-20130426/498_1 /TAXON_ID=31354 /ORGANISM="Compsopogon coeruleus, Strain SAG 36.94" /LENGTH=172 /DNA_ID=CAMNT_0027126075 /DNA_START=917 /DNA_END=1435 /DNA_ORIENTATION=-
MAFVVTGPRWAQVRGVYGSSGRSVSLTGTRGVGVGLMVSRARYSPSWIVASSDGGSSNGSTTGDQEQASSQGFRFKTRGEVLVAGFVALAVPLLGYWALLLLGVDDLQAGLWTSGLASVALFVWVGTYLFRVANKDMTYATQLREYEDGVLQRRYEELSEEEKKTLLREVDD